MTEVPGGEPPRDDSEGASAAGAPFPGYPPPYGASTPAVSDDELAAALAAQTAMYTGPITIPVLNSDPVFRPDPDELQGDVPPPSDVQEAPAPVQEAPASVQEASAPVREPVAPPVPVPPPPPAPEYIAPDAVASDPDAVAPPVAAAPEPQSVAQPVADAPSTADDDLSRIIEQEVASGSTLDAILRLEDELRRRQGLPAAADTEAPPAEVGAAFGAVGWGAPPDPVAPAADAPAASTAAPGWTDAPDPSREGEALAVFPPPVDAAPFDGTLEHEHEHEHEPESEPVPGPQPAGDLAWLSAPPPDFAPPPLVEPPLAAPAGPIDPTTLTPPPLADLPAPVLPPPLTTVDGPDGPVDVSLLPPPTASAVEIPVAGLQDAPPPAAEAIVMTGLPAPAGEAEVEGIDPLDRADLALPIPVDEAGVASVAPVPLSTATVVAVGEPPEPSAPSDPPAFEIEAVSVEPTPVERRAGHAARLFWLWFAANSSVVTVAVGATLFTLGMSLRQVLVSVLAGVALSALPLGLGSLAGKWSGQPTMVVSRATFGLVGNVVPAILAVAGRALWGGVLLWLLAVTADALLAPAEAVGLTAYIALAVGAVVAGIVAVLGYGLLHRVQRVLGILSLLLVAVIIGFTAQRVDIGVALRTDDGPWLLVVGGAVTVFSVVGLAWAQSSSDLARYQNPAGSGAANMLWGSFGAIVPALAIISWGGVLAASDPETADAFASAPLSTLLELVPPALMLPLFGGAAFGLVAGALIAMYSGGLAIVAAGLRAPRALSTLLAVVLVAAVAVGLLLLGADTRDVVRDVMTTVAVPVAAWTGIFACEMMIRLRRFHAPSLLERGGVYPGVRWVNLVGLLVISAVGLGLTTAELAGLTWQGYLFGLLGVPVDDPFASGDPGVLAALALGLVLPLVTAIPTIRRQERDREDAEAASGAVAQPS